MVPCGKALQKMGLYGDLQPRSENIKVTVTTFGTMVLCGKVLQNIRCTVTFLQGKGHIRATVTKLGTHASLMGFALLVTFIFLLLPIILKIFIFIYVFG